MLIPWHVFPTKSNAAPIKKVLSFSWEPICNCAMRVAAHGILHVQNSIQGWQYYRHYQSNQEWQKKNHDHDDYFFLERPHNSIPVGCDSQNRQCHVSHSALLVDSYDSSNLFINWSIDSLNSDSLLSSLSYLSMFSVAFSMSLIISRTSLSSDDLNSSIKWSHETFPDKNWRMQSATCFLIFLVLSFIALSP